MSTALWEENLKGVGVLLRETLSANASSKDTECYRRERIVLGVRQLCHLIFVSYWTSENGDDHTYFVRLLGISISLSLLVSGPLSH